MRSLLIFFVLLFADLSSAAEVYRWVDENGNVVYSDRPHPGAEKIDAIPVQTVPAPTAAPKAAASQPIGVNSSGEYLTFAIIAPADQENIHNPQDGNVTVSILLQPSLDLTRGHRLALQVDNQRLREPGQETEITVPNLDRGMHLVQAIIVDQNNTVVRTSSPVTFFVHRASARAKAP